MESIPTILFAIAGGLAVYALFEAVRAVRWWWEARRCAKEAEAYDKLLDWRPEYPGDESWREILDEKPKGGR